MGSDQPALNRTNKTSLFQKILYSNPFQYDKISSTNHIMALLLIILSSSFAFTVSPQG